MMIYCCAFDQTKMLTNPSGNLENFGETQIPIVKFEIQ